MQEMLTREARERLEKQQYKVVGGHSAVKTCGWTKNMIRGKGGCYKLKFYGILSNQCMQMTTSVSCANRCTFCWRDYKAPVAGEWRWQVNEPEFILEESLKAHQKLLSGFGGSETVNKFAYKKSKQVRHVALSLTGEPIIYPRINEAIELFHKKGISTFLVSNAQYPEEVKNLRSVTQLYLSLDAPEKALLKQVDVPLFRDYWERLNKSLEYLAEKKYRTCIRLTAIKDINMGMLDKYAEMIMKGNPDFVEVKAYMHVGASVYRLNRENMPSHEEVVKFSRELVKFLPDYELVSEHVPSRVVLIARKKFKKNGKWYTWIDFKKFFEIVSSGVEAETENYLRKTPLTGIKTRIKVDEQTDEMDFWKKGGC